MLWFEWVYGFDFVFKVIICYVSKRFKERRNSCDLKMCINVVFMFLS